MSLKYIKLKINVPSDFQFRNILSDIILQNFKYKYMRTYMCVN